MGVFSPIVAPPAGLMAISITNHLHRSAIRFETIRYDDLWTAKSVPPEPNCLVADVDASFMQQIFDLAQRQWKADKHHHSKAENLG